MIARVRVKDTWSSMRGCEGWLVDTFPADGYVLVQLDGDSRVMRFDEDMIELVEVDDEPSSV